MSSLSRRVSPYEQRERPRPRLSPSPPLEPAQQPLPARTRRRGYCPPSLEQLPKNNPSNRRIYSRGSVYSLNNLLLFLLAFFHQLQGLIALKLSVWQPICADDPLCGWAAGAGLQLGVDLMVEHINREGFLRGGAALEVDVVDTSCSASRGTEESVKLLLSEERPFGVLGCGCSPCSTQVAPLMSFGRIPLISQSSSAASLSNRNAYPNFFRILAPDQGILQALVAVFLLFRWDTCVGIYDSNGESTQMDYWTQMTTELNITDSLLGHSVAVLEDSQSDTEADKVIEAILATRARGVVGIMWAPSVRLISCRLGVNQIKGLLFATYGWFVSGWLSEDMTAHGCSAALMEAAWNYGIQGVSLAWNSDRSLPLPCSTSNNRSIDEFVTSMMDLVASTGVSYASDSSAAADGICMFAMAYNAMIDRGYSIEAVHYMNSSAFLDLMNIFQTTAFEGVSGPVSFLSDGTAYGAGDRIGSLSLLQTVDGTKAEVAIFDSKSSTISMLEGQVFMFQDGYTQDYPPDALFPACPSGTVYDFANAACIGCSETTIYIVSARACLCRPGYYQAGDSEDDCDACPSGSYSAMAGQGSCDACAPGQYQNDTGSSQCQSCPRASYASEIGQAECLACPEGTSTDGLGFASLEDCGCPEGTFMRAVDSSCASCGEGAVCNGFGAAPMAQDGYMLWEVTDVALSIFHCTDQDNCPGGVVGTCAPHRKGRSCAECFPGTTPAGDGSCRVCTAGDQIPFIAAIILGLGSMCGLYAGIVFSRKRRSSSMSVAIVTILGQFLANSQALAAIAKVNVDWEAPVDELLNLTKILTFDMELLRLGCHGLTTSFWSYIMAVVAIYGAMFAATLVHLMGLIWSRIRFASFDPGAVIVLVGFLMQGFTVVIISTMLAPVLCTSHPNGLYTVEAYPSILCWEGHDHRGMLVCAFISVLFPLAYASGLAHITWHFNAAVTRGDVAFLRRWGFIFFRAKPQAYWLPLLMLARSWFIVISIIPTSAIVQTADLAFLMLLWLCICLWKRPYICGTANVLEAVQTSAIIQLLLLVPAFVKDDANQALASEAAAFFFIAAAISLPMAAILLVRHKWASKHKPFQYFLSHHKDAAGAFARLLKLELKSNRKVQGDIFLDSDNLTDLDDLLDVVAFKVETVIILITERVFMRPWCLAELAMAHQQGLDLICLYFAGCDKPSDRFIDSLPSQVLDIEGLARFGLIHVHLQEALLRVQQCTVNYSMSDTLNPTTLKELASLMVAPQGRAPKAGAALSFQGVIPSITSFHSSSSFTIHSSSNRRDRSNFQEVYAFADWTDMEAVASAIILVRLMPIWRAMEEVPDLLIGGEVLPESASKCIFLCSAHVMEQESMLRSIVVATRCQIFSLPVFLNDDFKVSTAKDFTKSRKQCVYAREHFETVVHAAQIVFRTIAVRFSPKEHFSLVKMQVVSIGKRASASIDVRRVDTNPASNFSPTPQISTIAEEQLELELSDIEISSNEVSLDIDVHLARLDAERCMNLFSDSSRFDPSPPSQEGPELCLEESQSPSGCSTLGSIREVNLKTARTVYSI